MIVFLLLCTWGCALIGAGLMVWMFRRRDDFAGLIGLSMFVLSACFAAVYAGATS